MLSRQAEGRSLDITQCSTCGTRNDDVSSHAFLSCCPCCLYAVPAAPYRWIYVGSSAHPFLIKIL